MAITENVRRIQTGVGAANPDSHDYTGLGYVDSDGVYHFRDGRTLPTHGVTLVVQPNGVASTPGPNDGADPEGSRLRRLHAVDAKLQNDYDEGRIA
ncbi:hypothetical protein ACSW29_16650 [Rhodococcus sp. GB-02]